MEQSQCDGGGDGSRNEWRGASTQDDQVIDADGDWGE